MALLPIEPGNTPVFQVTPAFTGAAFTLDGTKAAVKRGKAAGQDKEAGE